MPRMLLDWPAMLTEIFAATTVIGASSAGSSDAGRMPDAPLPVAVRSALKSGNLYFGGFASVVICAGGLLIQRGKFLANLSNLGDQISIARSLRLSDRGEAFRTYASVS